MLKPPHEPSCGALERFVRVDVHKARVIDEGEQHVTKLIRHPLLIGSRRVELCAQLPQFLLHLVPNLACVVPIESHAPHLVLHAVGLHQAWQRFGHSLQHRGLPFLELEFLPIGLDGVLVVGIDVPIDVRVTVHEFVTDRVQCIGNVVPTLLGRNLGAQFGVEHHVQKEVARFFFDFVDILVQNGVGQFVSLLDGEMTKGLKGLLAVPWTFLPQIVHDVQQTTKCLEVLCTRVHAAKVTFSDEQMHPIHLGH